MNGSSNPLPLISVVVLNYNGRGHLEHCLPSLLRLDFPWDRLEILVVDNGSTDGSAELVEGFAPRVGWVTAGANLGFSAGNNLGARTARGEWVAFLNNDTRVDPGWLASLCRTLGGDGRAAAVTGKILDWEGVRLDFARGILTFDGHAFQQDAGLEVGRDPYREVAETFIFCGGNVLLRRALFLELGGFDEDFFAYLEDVDLSWRLWSAGHRVLFDPAAVVHHRAAGTSGRMDPFDRGFLFERNAFLTAVKNLDEERFPRVFGALLLTLLNRTFTLGARIADHDGLLGRYPFLADGYRADGAGGRAGSAARGALGDAAKGAPGVGSASAPGSSPRSGRRRASAVAPGREEGLLPRLWHWLIPPPIGGHPSLTVDHPHAISQLQAVHWILENLDRTLEKRREVQARRVVSDRVIFARFPLYLVPTYPGDESLFATHFFRWLLQVPVEERGLGEIHHR